MDPRRRSLVLAAPAAAVAGGCARRAVSPASAPALEPPHPRAGDRWSYRVINRYNGAPVGELQMDLTGLAPLVVAVRRDDEFAASTRSPGVALEARYPSPWSVSVEPSYDLVLNFAAPVPMLPSVLRVGERSTAHTRYSVRGYSGNYDWQQSLRALREEVVTVPAGTFRTLVVHREIWFDYPDPFRYRSSRDDTVWYAPEVNGWVRREWTGRYRTDSVLRGWYYEDWLRWELTNYRRNA
jgi:hypothetical protein